MKNPQMNLTPAEHVAQRTWVTLAYAKQLRARFGEEALTDMLVLGMLSHSRAKGFWLRQTTKHEEGRWGADLLVFVRHPTGRGSLLALQAKKLYPEDRYRELNKVSKSKDQLGKLEEFAQRRRALPFYLFYNHVSNARESAHWHCCSCHFDEHQLGCTLVPSRHVQRMLRPAPPYRDFDFAHNANGQSKPWRCVFDCPDAEKSMSQMAFRDELEMEFPGRRRHEPAEATWPEWLFRKSTKHLSMTDLDQILSELHPATDALTRRSVKSRERWLYPARFLIVDQWAEIEG